MEPRNVYPNYLIEYRERIRLGEIIAGRELITELDNLIEGLNDPRYRYDTKEAYMRISFMENLCLQSKKPYYMQPMKLLLWQKAFIEVIYSYKKWSEELDRWIRRFQDIILLSARKNGKTTLMAADAHTDLRIGDGGQDIVCAAASILAYTVAQLVKDYSANNMLKNKPTIMLHKGSSTVTCSPKKEYFDEVYHTFFVVQTGLNLLAHNYPQYLDIKMFGEP